MTDAGVGAVVRHMSNPSLSGRSWGDGGGRQSIHIIEDISFEQGMVRCACSAVMFRTDTLSTEDVWDMHRGRPDLVTERAMLREHSPQASTSEVIDFLELVRNPTYEFTGEDA